jgi:ABC-type branched-subunit amino acid transport system substrate-binding protein
LVLISPVSTDKSVNLANVPWMFSTAPPDHRQVPVLAEDIARRVRNGRFVVLSATDHDSHFFARELGQALSKRGLGPRFQFQFPPGEAEMASLVQRTLDSDADSVLLLAGVDDSARLTVALRTNGYRGVVFGRSVLAHRRFVQLAGEHAEGVVFPLLNPESMPNGALAEQFLATTGHRPDYTALHTYDAVQLVLAAIRQSGLNREKIRATLLELSPWQGVSGVVRWDKHGANTRTTALGTIEAGEVVRVTP